MFCTKDVVLLTLLLFWGQETTSFSFSNFGTRNIFDTRLLMRRFSSFHHPRTCSFRLGMHEGYDDDDDDDDNDDDDDKDGGIFYDDFSDFNKDKNENEEAGLIFDPTTQPQPPLPEEEQPQLQPQPQTTSTSTNIDPEEDFSGCSQRRFSLGRDVILSDYAGSLGFDEVTDWDYYLQDEETGERLKSVQPPPFDPSKPKRTRESSGSLVRIFRGEFVGSLGSSIRSMGMDNRILVKEFQGTIAADLAQSELRSMSLIQSELLRPDDDFVDDEYEDDDFNAQKSSSVSSVAASRYDTDGSTRQDDSNIIQLLQLLNGNTNKNNKGTPFVGIIGKLDLTTYFEDDEMDPNEWYRALKVTPPQPSSTWLVYEYVGLSTLGTYSQQPPWTRLSSLPPRRGMFGAIIPPLSLPPWKDRANYVINGILRGTLEAVATLHDCGIVHRSLGRNSIVLSSTGMDNTEVSSPYATLVSRLRVKLSDFGFSDRLSNVSYDESFRMRARGFGVEIQEGDNRLGKCVSFAIAEDLHALGFVFLGVLLTTLADLPVSTNDLDNVDYTLPPTDEDSLQRLWGDIFEKDLDEFRKYCLEDDKDVWLKLVTLLDENDGAGWDLLRSLCLARERAAENQDEMRFLTARGLLSNPLFQVKR